MEKPHPAGAEWGRESDAVVLLDSPHQGLEPLSVFD